MAPLGVLGLPELYLFVGEGDQWLIDDIVLLASEYASAGEDRTTLTGATFTTTDLLEVVVYGWGLEFGPEWKPVIDPGSNTTGVAVLTNGVSYVVVGVPGAGPDGDLTSCTQPRPRRLAASLKDLGLLDVADAVRQALEPVAAADGMPDEHRAFALYDMSGSAGGPMCLSIECRNIAGGEWVLGIIHVSPAAAYEEESVKRDELLAAVRPRPG